MCEGRGDTFRVTGKYVQNIKLYLNRLKFPSLNIYKPLKCIQKKKFFLIYFASHDYISYEVLPKNTIKHFINSQYSIPPSNNIKRLSSVFQRTKRKNKPLGIPGHF